MKREFEVTLDKSESKVFCDIKSIQEVTMATVNPKRHTKVFIGGLTKSEAEELYKKLGDALGMEPNSKPEEKVETQERTEV